MRRRRKWGQQVVSCCGGGGYSGQGRVAGAHNHCVFGWIGHWSNGADGLLLIFCREGVGGDKQGKKENIEREGREEGQAQRSGEWRVKQRSSSMVVCGTVAVFKKGKICSLIELLRLCWISIASFFLDLVLVEFGSLTSSDLVEEKEKGVVLRNHILSLPLFCSS